MDDQESFLTACNQIAKEILNLPASPIYIICHFDPDGLTAGSIIAHALRREKKTFTLRTLQRLEFSYLKKMGETIAKNSVVIFCDLGSGVIDAFLEWDK